MGKEIQNLGKAYKVFKAKTPAVSEAGSHGFFIRGVLADENITSKSNRENSLNNSVREIPTICPYCGVGCGFLGTTENGKLINIEGDPDNPFNKGTACSKGMAIRQLSAENSSRLAKVLYRAPGSSEWEEKTWDWTIDRIARRIKDTRDEEFNEKDLTGRIVNRTDSIAHSGCAPLNTEESYLISKLTRALGVVYIDHVVRL